MKIEKPIAAFCAAFIVLSASVVLAINISGLSFTEDLSAFSVKIKHYGVNTKEVEKTIAIPLEDELYGINNVKSILTVSENGSATAYITFKSKSKKSADGRYEAVSAAAQRVYESLPQSAQKPEIAMATENRRPVWTAALTSKKENDGISNIIERNIKPALKSIEGVAEVEVSGSGINEIIIALNSEHAAVAGFGAEQIASVLEQTDLMLPSGLVQEADREILVMVDGRYKDIDDLKNLPILGRDGKIVLLGEIASITKREREPDTLSRLNGKKTIVLSVYPAYNAPLGKLSKLIKQQVSELQKYPVVIDVLSDTGEEEARAFRSVLLATLQGMFAVALISALLIRGNNKNKLITIICTMVVPYICILSACILVICGFEFNKILLAGLSSGLGAAVDTTILCCEYLGACTSITEIKAKLKSIRTPLISGSLTTIIALTPIMFTEFATSGILTIAYSIAIVNFVSLFLALLILPPFFSLTLKNIKLTRNSTDKEFNKESSFLKYVNKFKRRAIRVFGLGFNFSIHRPKIIFAASILITVGGIITVLVCGTDADINENEKTVFGQIEFKGGIRAEVVDKSLELWGQKIKEVNGINSVQCSSHVDSSVVLVSFSPKLITDEQVRTILKNQKIQGGFLYIPENSSNERIWSITVSGDSTERCKEAARLLAQRCSAIPIVQETVLNFKDGSKNISFIPDRNRIAALGRTSKEGEVQTVPNIFSSFANVLRWNVHGPVAYKRLEQTGLGGTSSLNEVDVRIRGLGPELPEKSEVFNSVMNTGTGNGSGQIISVNSVMRNKEGVEESSIRRIGRRRVASISVRTAVADARKIKSIIMRELEKIELPSGYSIEFDRDAIEAAESLGKTGFYFMLAVLFCYMIIAAVNESFIVPLIVMSVVPVSASLSAIVLQASGFRFNAASACALLSVCGIAVNSSVVVVDNILEKTKSDYSYLSFYKAVRERFSVLFATTGTTILATLPFIFLKENSNTMIRALSIVTASGVLVSLLCSLFLVPTIFYMAKRKGVLRSGTKHLV
ncbi:MAG: efflux RND transporter permease subunit [Termitinemataceae bacterium]|nr:MAG: efflux RND transporter permease subunit [Termitinemataceae bacterium]